MRNNEDSYGIFQRYTIMHKPKIQISCPKSGGFYKDAVEKSGGIAVCGFCPEPDLACDGLILGGGGDVHPKYFGEAINGSAEIDISRDEAEFKLVEAFLLAGKPILGICRGLQVLNVCFGGSICQHLDSASGHTAREGGYIFHSVAADQGSILTALHGSSFFVNSSHHQGILRLGDGLRITAKAADGVIEAVEHINYPIFGVQWHPERMCFERATPDTADGSKLLSFFLDTCGGRADRC